MDFDQTRRGQICRCGAPLHFADKGVGESAMRHCSQLCYERQAKATWLSAPVFVAPRPLNLRDRLLAELASDI
jgi:hypothetical protein